MADQVNIKRIQDIDVSKNDIATALKVLIKMKLIYQFVGGEYDQLDSMRIEIRKMFFERYDLALAIMKRKAPLKGKVTVEKHRSPERPHLDKKEK